MQIGVIGLGRMGANISRRLMQAGHSTVVWDANAASVQGLGKEGAQGAGSLQGVVQALKDKPRAGGSCCPPAASPNGPSRNGRP
jgi:6-phosphogluconate dehydrogenase